MELEYFKTNWKDHIVDPITGEVIQQGTEIDAEHMNKIEDAIDVLYQHAERVISIEDNNIKKPENIVFKITDKSV